MLRYHRLLIIVIPLLIIDIYANSSRVSNNKEIRNLSDNNKALWIQEALSSIANGQYKDIHAIAWWNENFDNTYLKIDSSPDSLFAYQKGVDLPIFTARGTFSSNKLDIPSDGRVYHAAFPDFGGTEDKVTTESIKAFESLAQKKIVWAYFSNNWYNSIQFPREAVKTIHRLGKIPFIRMMPRSNFNEDASDPIYSMQSIIDGYFDNELTQWALDAKSARIPLLVEFGCEPNGNWFPWSGIYNGGAQTQAYGNENIADGPERFRDAYRHIIDIFQKNEVNNITWFFHINAQSDPPENWNTIAGYYPGDHYIDWLGVSVYGPQEKEDEYQSFTEIMSPVYSALRAISDKPIAILEFGITEIK